MPLSNRQKRRLFEVSKMIESSIVVKDDMEEIQLEYAQEIDSIISQIQCKRSSAKETAQIEEPSSSPVVPKHRKNTQLARELRKQRQRVRDARNYVPPPKQEIPSAPEWAKKLWKGIAKKCHPDRLSFLDLTALDIARRQIWFTQAKDLFEERSWPRLVHIGVQVGEFVDGVSHKEQVSWLNTEYNGVSEHITKLQSSLAWKWGTNWENIDLRVNILTAILKHKSIEVPPRQELVEIIIKLESD